MASTTVEARLAQLEVRVAELQAEVASLRSRNTKDWRRAVAKYAGDEDLRSLLADAQSLREEDRRRQGESLDEANEINE